MVAQVVRSHIEKIEYREKMLFWSLFSVFVLFLVSYGLLVNSTIFNVLARENLESQLSSLNGSVNTLASQYLATEDNINLNFALAQGFVAVPQDTFAMIPANTTPVLSVNEN